MPTDFFYRKYIKITAFAIAVIVTCFSLVYAKFLSQVRVENGVGQVYFLVMESRNVEATSQFLQWDGGAGYFMEYNGEEYVATSVYFEESDGLTVQAGLRLEGKSTELLALGNTKLYFKGNRQKKRAEYYLGALRAFYGCLQVFGKGIAVLERGTQEQTKRYYAPLERQFRYLGTQYADGYPSFSKICEEGAGALDKMSSQTLYVKDLRYLLCQLSMEYVILTANFSL